jgi:peptide/nickel transport system substrate-binding protein
MRKGYSRTMQVGVLLFAVGLVSFAFAADEAPKFGGTYKIAVHSEIPNIDPMLTTADVAYQVGGQIFETLVQYLTGEGPIAPELADSWVVSGDKLKYTFSLRRGIKFHDGSIMTSQDVLASLERWLKYGGRGANVRPYIDHFAAPDDYTFEVYLKQPYSPLLSLLGFGNGGPIIVPAKIARGAGGEVLKPENCIGTGPYKFGKWVQGEYIRLDRFDGYVPRKEPPNGRAGKKVSYFDHVEFHVVQEVAAAVNGVKAGQFHFGTSLPADLYGTYAKDRTIRVVKLEPTYWCQIFFNTKQGVCANQGLRQAILAVLNMEEILISAFGELGEVQGSLFPKSTPWYVTGGLQKYNQKNPKLGWQLAQKAGYKGEKIRMLVGTQWPQNDLSQVVAKQLKDAGFSIDFLVYDWAALVSLRAKPENWDLFITSSSAVYYDPAISYWLSATYPGWWDTPEKNAILKEFVSKVDLKERLDVWSKFQELFYTQVPIIKFGDYYELLLAATQDKVGGFGTKTHPVQTFVYTWNMWLP